MICMMSRMLLGNVSYRLPQRTQRIYTEYTEENYSVIPVPHQVRDKLRRGHPLGHPIKNHASLPPPLKGGGQGEV